MSFTISSDGNINPENVNVFVCTSPEPMAISYAGAADWMNQAVRQNDLERPLPKNHRSVRPNCPHPHWQRCEICKGQHFLKMFRHLQRFYLYINRLIAEGDSPEDLKPSGRNAITGPISTVTVQKMGSATERTKRWTNRNETVLLHRINPTPGFGRAKALVSECTMTANYALGLFSQDRDLVVFYTAVSEIRRGVGGMTFTTTTGRHYRMNLGAYCRFTSPLRRASDFLTIMYIKEGLRWLRVRRKAKDTAPYSDETRPHRIEYRNRLAEIRDTLQFENDNALVLGLRKLELTQEHVARIVKGYFKLRLFMDHMTKKGKRRNCVKFYIKIKNVRPMTIGKNVSILAADVLFIRFGYQAMVSLVDKDDSIVEEDNPDLIYLCVVIDVDYKNSLITIEPFNRFHYSVRCWKY